MNYALELLKREYRNELIRYSHLLDVKDGRVALASQYFDQTIFAVNADFIECEIRIESLEVAIKTLES
jgi:hypothetical protein